MFSRIPSLAQDIVGIFEKTETGFDYTQYIPVTDIIYENKETTIKLHTSSER